MGTPRKMPSRRTLTPGNRTVELPALHAGDTIGVVAPAFVPPAPELNAGIAWLEAQGFTVRRGKNLRARNGYLAGTDSQRGADLAEMIRDRSVRGIWFARGGYGSARLLDEIPWRHWARDPKPMIGYSDLTAIFNAALDRCGAIGFYGPVVMELATPRLYHSPSLFAALAGKPASLAFAKKDVLVPGRGEGRLFGGNLSVLTHLCGTEFAPRSSGGVLFLEEIGEGTYRLDRMLTQLRQSGMLDGLAGVLLGTLSVPPRQRFPPDRRPVDVLREFFGELGVPVVRFLPSGHRPGKQTIPIGATARVDTRARLITFR